MKTLHIDAMLKELNVGAPRFGGTYREQHRGWLQRFRKKSARSPEWRGALVIDGVEYHLSGWVAQDRFGKPMLSLRATKRPKERTS